MKASVKETVVLSPLMRPHGKRKGATARLIGAISKARAREWVRHIARSRRDWN